MLDLSRSFTTVSESIEMDRGLERELNELGLHAQWDEQIKNMTVKGNG